MSTAPLHSFMVYAPDYPDSVERRKQVREQHLSGIKELVESGVFKSGGALLSPESIESADAPQKMVGSMLIIQAESLAAASKRIESDIYWTANVWDKERLVISPIAQFPVPK